MSNHEKLSDPLPNLLIFPCLIQSGELLLPITKRSFIKYIFRGYADRHILLGDGSLPKLERKWFITADGLFWKIERVRTRRGFWRKLAPMIDFTLAECRLEPGKCLTTNEILRFAEPLKSYSGFPTAGQFKKFLRNNPNKDFSEIMFKEFWQKHGFELKPPDVFMEVMNLRPKESE